MSPPGAIAGRMRVAVLIRFLMVDSMCSNPRNGTPLQIQSATNREEILEKPRRFEGSMSDQARKPHPDRQARAHPEQEKGDGQSHLAKSEHSIERPHAEG